LRPGIMGAVITPVGMPAAPSARTASSRRCGADARGSMSRASATGNRAVHLPDDRFGRAGRCGDAGPSGEVVARDACFGHCRHIGNGLHPLRARDGERSQPAILYERLQDGEAINGPRLMCGDEVHHRLPAALVGNVGRLDSREVHQQV